MRSDVPECCQTQGIILLFLLVIIFYMYGKLFSYELLWSLMSHVGENDPARHLESLSHGQRRDTSCSFHGWPKEGKKKNKSEKDFKIVLITRTPNTKYSRKNTVVRILLKV